MGDGKGESIMRKEMQREKKTGSKDDGVMRAGKERGGATWGTDEDMQGGVAEKRQMDNWEAKKNRSVKTKDK